MGRLLDIARKTKSALAPTRSPADSIREDCLPKILPPHLPPCMKPPCNLPVAEVVSLIAQLGKPVPHSAIVKALVERGHDKALARQAIARCQQQGEVEHDLVAGYVLTQA